MRSTGVPPKEEHGFGTGMGGLGGMDDSVAEWLSGAACVPHGALPYPTATTTVCLTPCSCFVPLFFFFSYLYYF